MPRVAALLGVNQVSDVMHILDDHTFKRPIYAGNAIITVKTPQDKPVVATIRTASFKPAASGAESASIESLPANPAADHTRFIKLESGDSERQRWTRDLSPTTCKSGRPAKSSHRIYTWP